MGMRFFMSNCRVLHIILGLAFAVSAAAFAPVKLIEVASSYRTASSLSPLFLVPEQGRQLVAYSQAALAKKAKESASKASNLSDNRRRSDSEGGLAKARNIMTRLLHLSPSNEGSNTPHSPSSKSHHDIASFMDDISEEKNFLF